MRVSGSSRRPPAGACGLVGPRGKHPYRNATVSSLPRPPRRWSDWPMI
jgi:hypothetical protein